jgi:hypothetical protein
MTLKAQYFEKRKKILQFLFLGYLQTKLFSSHKENMPKDENSMKNAVSWLIFDQNPKNLNPLFSYKTRAKKPSHVTVPLRKARTFIP